MKATEFEQIMARLDRMDSALRICTAEARLQRARLAALITITVSQGDHMADKLTPIEEALAGIRTSLDNVTEKLSEEAAQVGTVLTELEQLRADAAANNIPTERFDAVTSQLQEMQSRLEGFSTQIAGLVPDASPSDG